MAKKTLMTEGNILRTLVRFAFPLFLGNLFQQMYNAADSLVVGNFCGDSALAAVSSSGSLCFLLIGFMQGMFVGASVIISRRYGAGDPEGVDKAIHTTVVFAFGAGILISVVGVLGTPVILRWMGTPESVMPESVLYFRIYCAGLLGLVLYNMTNSVFQALGDSRHPLYYLIISSLANIVLDLLFVAVFDMGVAGAALATVLGQTLSAVLGFLHLMSGRFIVRISWKKLTADWNTLVTLLRLGLPSGVQNSVISIANVVVQSNINAFGDVAMAGCGSYSKIEGFVFLPVMSLSLAMTTFISQNLGAGRQERVRKGMRIGIILAVVGAELIGIALYLFSPVALRLFSQTPEVLDFGVRQARAECLFFGLMAFSHGAAATLRGAGRSMLPMFVMLGTWCLLRITYITILIRLIPNILVVFSAYPLTWFASAVIFAAALKWSNWMPDPEQRL